MARRTTTAKQRKRKEFISAVRNITLVIAALAVVGFFYFKATRSHRALDETTLCPTLPDSVTVLLVDVTDPMNLPQRQDFFNQFEAMIQTIPRYGKLTIIKVDPVSDQLLSPVITRCNPGTSSDVSEYSGNPKKLDAMHRSQFLEPLKGAFEELAVASGAPRSPIMESIQSINLTELKRGVKEGGNRRLVIASDLLQHTESISFYNHLPEPDELTGSAAFDRVRTDLRDTDVEMWLLLRGDAKQTQPRRLPELWEALIRSQGGRLVRVYTVSG